MSAGLGFSREDRNTNVQRVGPVAEVLARNGVLAVVPVIAPYADSREAVRGGTRGERHTVLRGACGHPVEVCAEGDVKGAVRAPGRGSADRAHGRRRPPRAPGRPRGRAAHAAPDAGGVRGAGVPGAGRPGDRVSGHSPAAHRPAHEGVNPPV
ncbi:adenylyl-sulfate kinase [Streptomyces cavernae]|uniref:adenylyl-sulfate kinase n=1 Tax=Streptomyces cavernae TaxID=2259034 RepID=UPI002367D19E|nr:adenylyl-sulfate kinase [Streptomyces cavernae]